MNVTAYQLDALKELINIGVGRAAGTLNQMLDSHVHLQVPDVRVLSATQVRSHEMIGFDAEKLSAVQLTFKGLFSGMASLVFPPDSAAKLIDLITGQESGAVDLDALRIGALTEVGNIVLNGVMGSISNILDQRINYTIPSYMEDNIENLLALRKVDVTTTIVLARTQFIIARLAIAGDIFLFFEVGSFEMLLDTLEA